MICYNHLTLPQATAIQDELSTQLQFDLAKDLNFNTIGGADISFNQRQQPVFRRYCATEFPVYDLAGIYTGAGQQRFPLCPGILRFQRNPQFTKSEGGEG